MVTRSQICVNNAILVQDNKTTDKAIHLGHNRNTDDKDCIVSAAIKQILSSFNLFRADFGHIQSCIQCKLFNQIYCRFNGVPLWLLSSDHINDVCVGWRKALRKFGVYLS